MGSKYASGSEVKLQDRKIYLLFDFCLGLARDSKLALCIIRKITKVSRSA